MIEETKGSTFRFLIFYGKQRRVFVMKERILEGGMAVYRKKGPKFTMDDLANELGMSKKTIYTVFRDKKSLLYDMVDYTFDAIKQSEAEVLADTNKSTIEKLRGILGVMPERFRDFDFTQVYEMNDKYPECYDRIQQRLDFFLLHRKGIVQEFFYTFFHGIIPLYLLLYSNVGFEAFSDIASQYL